MDLLQKIYRLEIMAKGLTKHFMSGAYHSAFKGRGMTFSEVRAYQFGDEVRSIDWNVTARFDAPFVKVFEEERELVMMFLIDVSASQHFGSTDKSKRDLILQTMAILAFSALANNDKVGALFVSDRVEKYIPPQKGRKHILYMLRQWMTLQPTSLQTDLGVGLKFFQNTQKKRTICFVMSDFLGDKKVVEALKIARKKHDVIALKTEDTAEYQLPKIGFVQLYNAERKATTWINTSDVQVRNKFERDYFNKKQQQLKQFAQNGIDYAVLNTASDAVLPLVQLFQKRGSKK